MGVLGILEVGVLVVGVVGILAVGVGIRVGVSGVV